MSYVQLSAERKNGKAIALEAGDGNNIEGILVALRYLSHEAEGAGLKELANTLEDAARYCARLVTTENKN
ncbi:MAG: hypothetical protein ACLPPF_08400 [Rhodomicrobium sp.]